MEEAAQWQRKLQDIVMENSEHHIPAVFHMEGLCGAFIQDMTAFPSGVNRVLLSRSDARSFADRFLFKYFSITVSFRLKTCYY